jgi:hypothetical protein
MTFPDTEEGPEYDTGPFCQHWSDPSDCEEKCARCGLECRRHGATRCQKVISEKDSSEKLG